MLPLLATFAVLFGDTASLIDVRSLEPRWQIDIRYATSDNFTGKVLYPVARCVLRKEVANMLTDAQKYLDTHAPGYSFILKDCYRPVSVQREMWKVVQGTPMQSYVANPHSRTGSVHNYGCAVDLTLADQQGREVDMGTPYDHLGILAQPRYEDRFMREGKLTQTHVAKRRLLRDAMVKGGGFHIIRNEWWHFDAWRGRELRKRYGPLDVPLEQVGR